MARGPKAREGPSRTLARCPTGILGLDEITGGGLPRGRPTLVCDGAGSGKTLLAMELLVHGATQYGEPGVFMAFEETPAELTENVRSLGFDNEHLAGRYKIEIVDLMQNPQLARGDRIVAIPTLVRKLPAPVRKIIGDLADTERTLVGLQLRPRSS